MVRIKVCGITDLDDALMAAQLGVDALGFIFTRSKRRILPEKAQQIISALPPFVTSVGVFMNAPIKQVNEIIEYTGVEIVQLHGEESPSYCRKIARRIIKRLPVVPGQNPALFYRKMASFGVSAYLFDPGMGSGQVFDWQCVQGIKGRFIIAGGLNANNVRQVVELLSPYGVDVATGVESSPGKKEYSKLQLFVQEVRSCTSPA